MESVMRAIGWLLCWALCGIVSVKVGFKVFLSPLSDLHIPLNWFDDCPEYIIYTIAQMLVIIALGPVSLTVFSLIYTIRRILFSPTVRKFLIWLTPREKK